MIDSGRTVGETRAREREIIGAACRRQVNATWFVATDACTSNTCRSVRYYADDVSSPRPIYLSVEWPSADDDVSSSNVHSFVRAFASVDPLQHCKACV